MGQIINFRAVSDCAAEPAFVEEQERRRVAWSHRPPLASLDELPTRIVLERLPVPVIAVETDGHVLFVNSAFAGLLDCDAATLYHTHIEELFGLLPSGKSAIERLRDCAGLTVQLRGTRYAVAVRVSQSLLRRRHDPLALVVLQDVTAWG